MSWHGIRTVAQLELRQRVRTSRWPVVLGVWMLVVGLVSVLAYRTTRDPEVRSGEAMYDVVVFFVLGLAMLIVPSLTATSVNGDREHGVLATLQTTLLTTWDLVLGKLVAAWAISLAFLATALPFLAWAFTVGGISAGAVVRSLLVLVLVLAVVCAIGLMFSTLTARPVGSAVLTYLTVGFLAFGTVIGFGLTAYLVSQEEDTTVHGIPDSWWQEHQPSSTFDPADPNLTPEQREQLERDMKAMQEPTQADCTTFTRRQTVAHTERIWWLLAPNPFVVVADAAPSEPRRAGAEYVGAFTPMRWISGGVRSARSGPPAVHEECHFQTQGGPSQPEPPTTDPIEKALAEPPVWPWGLATLVLAGMGATFVAARRLRTPIRRLPNGTRIA